MYIKKAIILTFLSFLTLMVTGQDSLKTIEIRLHEKLEQTGQVSNKLKTEIQYGLLSVLCHIKEGNVIDTTIYLHSHENMKEQVNTITEIFKTTPWEEIVSPKIRNDFWVYVDTYYFPRKKYCFALLNFTAHEYGFPYWYNLIGDLSGELYYIDPVIKLF